MNTPFKLLNSTSLSKTAIASDFTETDARNDPKGAVQSQPKTLGSFDSNGGELRQEPLSPLSPLHGSLNTLATKAIKRISQKKIGSDTLLGNWFPVASVAAKLQKAHGKDLPTALGRILEERGLLVWHEPVIGLSSTAVALAGDNTIETLSAVVVPPCSSDRKDYRPDLIVHCPKTGCTIAIEGKRGGGQSDSTAKNEATVNVRATYLSLPQWAREKGLQPTICDARVVDFCGSSSFADELVLYGWQLDAFFGCAIEDDLAYYGACLRVGAEKLLSNINGQAPQSEIINPMMLIDQVRFRAPEGLKPHLKAHLASHCETLSKKAVGHGAHLLNLDDKLSFARPSVSRKAALARLMAAGGK